MKSNRVCPICSSSYFSKIFTQEFSKHFKHDVVNCNYCGFIFINNVPKQQYYDQYYKNV
jgi:rubredoxin